VQPEACLGEQQHRQTDDDQRHQHRRRNIAQHRQRDRAAPPEGVGVHVGDGDRLLAGVKQHQPARHTHHGKSSGEGRQLAEHDQRAIDQTQAEAHGQGQHHAQFQRHIAAHDQPCRQCPPQGRNRANRQVNAASEHNQRHADRHDNDMRVLLRDVGQVLLGEEAPGLRLKIEGQPHQHEQHHAASQHVGQRLLPGSRRYGAHQSLCFSLARVHARCRVHQRVFSRGARVEDACQPPLVHDQDAVADAHHFG